MKYTLLVFLLAIAVAAHAQNGCKTAYIHGNKILDSLPVPEKVQRGLDSFNAVLKPSLEADKKAMAAKYTNPRAVAMRQRALDRKYADSAKKEKYRLMNKVYGKKIKDACMKIYDKGKKYESVMNADNKYFSHVPPDSCDVTAEALKMVRASFTEKGEPGTKE